MLLKLIGKFVSFFSLFYTRLTGLSFWRFLALAYPILLLFGGILQNPVLACVVAIVYEIGLCGIAFVYSAKDKSDKAQLESLGLGGLLIFVCILFLEVMAVVVPHG